MILSLWNSPTFMTWGNMLVRTLGLALLLPLVLSRLPQADIVVWFLFSSLMVLQMLVDMGFMQTFARLIAYSMGGVDIDSFRIMRDPNRRPPTKKTPNWKSIQCVERVMYKIYLRMTLFALCLGGIFGSWALYGSIAASSNVSQAWLAWMMVLLSSCWMLFGNYFSAFLLGLNKVALVQRWQMIINLIAIVLASLTLLIRGDLLSLVVVYQGTLAIGVVVNYGLKKHVSQESGKFTASSGEVHTVWEVTWPVAWRSGIGVLMSAGLIQLSGVVYAQLGETGLVASYLLGLKLVSAISSFSQAPFYSRIPLFSSLYAAHDTAAIIQAAKRAMRLAYAVFTACFIVIGVFSDDLMALIGSNAIFPGAAMWSMLGLGFFIERYGAMHIQLYSVTNHIVWHIANGVTGLIMIVVVLFLYPGYGVYAFPLSMLVGYACFYAIYSARHSYREFGLKFVSFEKSVMLPWLAVMIAGSYFIFYAKT